MPLKKEQLQKLTGGNTGTNKLELIDVHKTKPLLVSGKLRRVEVLHGISFNVGQGEIVALLGPSGSGKSTVLRVINRLEDATSGQVLLDGKDTRSFDVRALRRRIGMVFQVPALLDGTVAENILYGPNLHGRTCGVETYLEMVGLEPELRDRPAGALSLGQQQRVSIARALANEPDVLLMDEPTSALDATAAHNVLELIKRLNASLGLTVVIVTHVMEHARVVADRVVLLVGGRKVEEGKAEDFFKEPRSEEGKRFLTGSLEVKFPE